MLGLTKFRRLEKVLQGNCVEEHNFPYAPALLVISYQCRGHEDLRPLPPPAATVPCPVEEVMAAGKSLLKFSKLTQQI